MQQIPGSNLRGVGKLVLTLNAVPHYFYRMFYFSIKFLPETNKSAQSNLGRGPRSDLPFSTMHWTERPTDARTYVRTDRQTDRSSTGKLDDYSPLRYESDEG